MWRRWTAILVLTIAPSISPGAEPSPGAPSRGAGLQTRQAREALARPPAEALRADLRRILARPEYQATGRDWLRELQLRLMARVVRWYLESVAPLFAGLFSANPIAYWAIVGVACALLLAVLYHIYLGLRTALGSGRRARARAPGAVLPERLGGPEELLAEADAAAQAGRFAEALRWLYLALIRHLDRREVLRFDPSATDHDYLRQLRPPPDVAQYLAPLTRTAEPVWYGYATVGPEDYQRCREWAMAAWREAPDDAPA